MTDLEYQVLSENKEIVKGSLDSDGRTPRFTSSKPEKLKALVGGKQWAYIASRVGGSYLDPIVLQFYDPLEQSISDLKYQVWSDGKLISQGSTDGQGEAVIQHFSEKILELHIQKFGSDEMKPLCAINHHLVRKLILVSPKILREIILKSDDVEGEYLRGTYNVKEGEALDDVAHKYGTTKQELLILNDFLRQDITLQEGMVLQVPAVKQRKKS